MNVQRNKPWHCGAGLAEGKSVCCEHQALYTVVSYTAGRELRSPQSSLRSYKPNILQDADWLTSTARGFCLLSTQWGASLKPSKLHGNCPKSSQFLMVLKSCSVIFLLAWAGQEAFLLQQQQLLGAKLVLFSSPARTTLLYFKAG